MKYIIFISLFITYQVRADFFLIQNEKVYLVQSKYAPENTSIEKARFLKISLKQNHRNGTVSYKSGGIASPRAISIDKVPSSPKIIAGEGCSKNPMSWLKLSKVYGRLKGKDSAMYIQIAPEVTSAGKTTQKCPSGDKYTDNPLQFAVGNKDFAVLVCSDELNYNLLVMKANAIEADLTITDNCP